MTRLYADPVEVSRRDDAPELFLWRGRLYQVRDVLAHWVEAGQWWRSTAATALTAGDQMPSAQADDLVLAPIPSSPKWAQRAWGEPAPDVGASVGPAGVDDREREYWRVEASAGRTAGGGVYDLCLDWSRGGWTVARVLD
jgi:hypothetical protein